MFFIDFSIPECKLKNKTKMAESKSYDSSLAMGLELNDIFHRSRKMRALRSSQKPISFPETMCLFVLSFDCTKTNLNIFEYFQHRFRPECQSLVRSLHE